MWVTVGKARLPQGCIWGGTGVATRAVGALCWACFGQMTGCCSLAPWHHWVCSMYMSIGVSISKLPKIQASLDCSIWLLNSSKIYQILESWCNQPFITWRTPVYYPQLCRTALFRMAWFSCALSTGWGVRRTCPNPGEYSPGTTVVSSLFIQLAFSIYCNNIYILLYQFVWNSAKFLFTPLTPKCV